VNSAWRRGAGGCNLNRKMGDLIRTACFRVDDLRTGYGRGPRVETIVYEGRARPE
jgi:hypothetical protein